MNNKVEIIFKEKMLMVIIPPNPVIMKISMSKEAKATYLLKSSNFLHERKPFLILNNINKTTYLNKEEK